MRSYQHESSFQRLHCQIHHEIPKLQNSARLSGQTNNTDWWKELSQVNLSLSISLAMIVYLFSSVLFSVSIFLFLSFPYIPFNFPVLSFDLTFFYNIFRLSLSFPLSSSSLFLGSRVFYFHPISLYFRLLFSLSFLLISVSSVLRISCKLTRFLFLFLYSRTSRLMTT